MNFFPDLKLLRTSWTKYDCVQVIQMVIKREIELYLNQEKSIDEPILRSFLGINNIKDPLPIFWVEIYKYPQQVGLFALVAALFTHYENIELFATQFNKGDMHGVFTMLETSKHFTNLRSAIVESGAADKLFRKRQEVPYDLSLLFEEGAVGPLVKALLKNRLERIGCSPDLSDDEFFDYCIQFNFIPVFGLTNPQFIEWVRGEGISNSLFELSKNGITYEKYGRIKALKVRQWLNEWDNIPNFDQKNRRKPSPYFYQFNIPGILLKRIYDVHARRANVNREEELHSQRKYNEQRSNEIREFIHGGFPWSTISDQQRQSDAYKNLRMPGWLPTSIIANILSEVSTRRQKKIEDDSIIRIEQIDDNFADIILPQKIWSDKWAPIVSPIEIIDGQHRIKAFDNIFDISGNFDFPIVAFEDLDFTWQAYLFYTINIKPKRINTSLAYDLMPLLRIQEWLDQDLNGPEIYKKIRAQELTELLWSTPASPWYNRINMLGDTGPNKGGQVSQNAFINSLTVSFVKKWDSKIGGLFGGEMHEGEQDVIQWDKETQAAYLILIWQSINYAISISKSNWVLSLRPNEDFSFIQNGNTKLAPAFIDDRSFFTTDQGIRPILFIFNDLSFMASDQLDLQKFNIDIDYEKYTTSEVIELILERFKKEKFIREFISEIARIIINNFDWRTPSAFDPTIPEQDILRQNQNQFRGSSGYKEMRLQLLRALEASKSAIHFEEKTIDISQLALEVKRKIGF